jgi:ssDNA-binding Zn-finger/Zn-ribbon topoisomerase 1
VAQKRAKKTLVDPRSMDEVRQELHQLIDAVWERVYKKNRVQPDGHYPNFSERESQVALLGREITELLLEGGVLTDPRYQEIMKAETLPCPECKTVSPRAVDEEKQALMDEITLETKVGQIPLSGPLFRCPKCRRNFSPLKTFLGTRQRKSQYGAAAESELGWG